MRSGQPEIVDNRDRYAHAAALSWLAEQYARPLRVATGYLNLGGLRELADLGRAGERSTQLMVGVAPPPGLGETGLLEEAREAGRAFDETLRRLRAERDFDAFPPSRRLKALQAVDEFLSREEVEVRRYTSRFLHGKAYIFAPGSGDGAAGPGAALVTSANLTGGGLHGNLELGTVQYQPNIVGEAASWFDELWEEAEDFKDVLRERLFPDIPQYSPQDIFLRMLLEYYRDELPDEPVAEASLARFQRDGYRRARRIVEKHGGVLYADGVGTGKTFIGLEFIKEYAKEQGKHVLVVAPAQLRDTNWEGALRGANLPGQVVSFQQLAMDDQLAHPEVRRQQPVLSLDKDVYRLVIVDEAHALRNPDTTYYHALDRLLGGTKKDLVLLTATPVNNALWDLYHQIMLFARHGRAFAEPLGIGSLRDFFAECGASGPEAVRPEVVFPLMDAVTVRRDRRFLERHYAGDHFADGTEVRFPKPLLKEKRYDLDGAYPGATDRITSAIGALTMARYRADSYRLDADGEAPWEHTLEGLIKSVLLKRFESSVSAAAKTVSRMLEMQRAALRACEEGGLMPSPATLRDFSASMLEGEILPELVVDALEDDEEAIPLSELREDFLPDLRADVGHLEVLEHDLGQLASQPDPKLAALVEVLRESEAKKIAIFTSYADTGRYLREQLEPDPGARGGRAMGTVLGDEGEVGDRETLLRRFCPRSMDGPARPPVSDEVDLLVATDVLSEGQNLQEAQAVISYDMPWNPQRVVQRNGRVIRLKSEHEEVHLHTLLPEAGELEAILKLEARIAEKIQAANASVGMESQVLAALANEERIYADLQGFANRLAEGDETLLDDGEGAESGSSAGEEYRLQLLRAQREGEIPRLEEMPWGVGAAFARHAGTPQLDLPAVVFAAQDRRGRRHWRGVTAGGEVLSRDLLLLRAADPAEAAGTSIPDSLDLDVLWEQAASDICRTHNEARDPLAGAVALPASQRWALERLRDSSLPMRDEFSLADEALAVPRDRAVQRALSQVRREFEAAERPVLDTAEEIARTVLDEFGLQPVEVAVSDSYELKPEDVGVVAYQVVL